MNCELCEIINETFRLVKESEHSFCVVCTQPLKRGHVMVLPKRHVTDLKDMTQEEAKDFLDLIEEIKKKIQETYKQDTITIQNSGKHSTQPHIHFIILPMREGIRHLVSTFDDVPIREDKPDSFLAQIRDEICKS